MVYSVDVGEPAKQGEGRARRATISPDELASSPDPGVETLGDVVQYAVRNYASQNALGQRKVIRTHEEKKEITKMVDGKPVKEEKTWKYFELSDYNYYTFTEVGTIVKEIGSGLANLDIDSSTNFNIFASTSSHWLMTAMACFCTGITFCTAYDSLGVEGLEHSLNEPEVVGLLTDATLLRTVADALKNTPTVRVVIYDGELSDKDKGLVEQIQQTREDVKCMSLQELRQLGRDQPKEGGKPKPEDTACIMYTSGSTGKPKGVILSHKNLVSSIAGVRSLLADFIVPGESYIAYLPLAHVLEFIVELTMFSVSITMGYGNVKTLTDASVRNCKGDIAAFRPTIMCGVPAVWELIRKGIEAKVASSGTLKSTIFHGAMKLKQANSLLFGGVTNAVVFNAVRAATGGRLKYALSGGAPISAETQQFLLTALTKMIQGYGMTESCGMCGELRYLSQTIGVPVPSIEIKLVDVADAGYYSSNKPPQGEIYIRGNSVTSGYYKRPDINKETFTEDGWLMTGDVGQWNSDGTLSIIDRKKNLVKLSGGEYVALEKLEATYKGCPIVSNIMVHAESDAKQPLAVIFPHEKNLAKAAGVSEDMNALCSDKKVKEVALRELNATGKKAGFKQLELLQDVVLVSDEWTPQNGLLTAAQKLQRKAIFEKYKDEIKKVYP